MFDPAVIEPGDADGCSGNEGHGDEGVSDAAMVLESFDRAGKSPNNIEVGGFGGEYRSQRSVGGFAIESGAADAGAGQEVGDGFHGVLLFMVAEWAGLRRQSGFAMSAEVRRVGARVIWI